MHSWRGKKILCKSKLLKVSGWCVNCIICNLDFRYIEVVVCRCSSEQMILKISQCWSFFLIKLPAFRPTILLKRDSNIGAFCEICKIFKSILLTEHFLWLLWKYLMNSLFIAYENDEWCHCVVRIGSTVLILFYCVCFFFFIFLSFFTIFLWILVLA